MWAEGDEVVVLRVLYGRRIEVERCAVTQVYRDGSCVASLRRWTRTGAEHGHRGSPWRLELAESKQLGVCDDR